MGKQGWYEILIQRGFAGQLVQKRFVGQCPAGHPVDFNIYNVPRMKFFCASCYRASRSRNAPRRAKAVAFLLSKGFVGNLVGDVFSGTCSRGHEFSINIVNSRPTARKHICKHCYHESHRGVARRSPVIVEVGQRFGDNEVIEYLGVIDGHSRVRVKHLPTQQEHVTTVSALRSGKCSGYGRSGSAIVKRRRYGVPFKPGRLGAKRQSQKTFGELRKRLAGTGLVVSSIYPDDARPSYPNSSSHRIEYTCFCGTLSSTRFDALWHGGTRSCGCNKSKAQAELFNFLKELAPDAVLNDRSTIAPYELDIFVPGQQIAIEFCGLHWHGEKKLSKKMSERGHTLAKVRRVHLDKLRRCQAVGVRLITIFSDEWLTKRSVVQNRLKVILVVAQNGPGARDLKIRVVRSTIARPFLSVHHIQGACRSRLYLGAFSHDVLVAVMSFSRPNASRSSVGKYDWELVRFATDGKIYSGVASRLLCRFVNLQAPTSVVSYSDNRWSDGHLYRLLGFNLFHESPPSYWYFKDHGWGERLHRYGFRKSVALRRFGGNPEVDTEWDIMSRNGYDRIWDCGAKTWLWTNAKMIDFNRPG